MSYVETVCKWPVEFVRENGVTASELQVHHDRCKEVGFSYLPFDEDDTGKMLSPLYSYIQAFESFCSEKDPGGFPNIRTMLKSALEGYFLTAGVALAGNMPEDLVTTTLAAQTAHWKASLDLLKAHWLRLSCQK